MKNVYISVGNSDDKLSQEIWSFLLDDVVGRSMNHASNIHGIWFSEPRSRYQNACICVEVPGERLEALRWEMQHIARAYGQDSIAFAVAEVEML